MHHPAKTEQEWMDLITSCRASGLTDKEWCEQNGIPLSTFYNTARRLRKKAFQIPPKASSRSIIDLTTSQDIVKVNIVDKDTDLAIPESTPYLDNPLYTIEVQVDHVTIRLSNNADPKMAGQLVRVIGGLHAR